MRVGFRMTSRANGLDWAGGSPAVGRPIGPPQSMTARCYPSHGAGVFSATSVATPSGHNTHQQQQNVLVTALWGRGIISTSSFQILSYIVAI